VAETSYASCGDLSLAYQVFGDGPVELVLAGSFASHVELYWASPEFEAFMKRLATFCRVLLFDKAGVGLSDPVPKVRTLDDRAGEIEAVMDAVGFDKAVLFGVSEGGPAPDSRAGRRWRNPRLAHRVRPGRWFGHRLRRPRQRRAAWRARHRQLLAVHRDGPPPGSAEADLASTPTPRPTDRDAQPGPRCGGDREARTVDCPRDRQPHPGHPSSLNSPNSTREPMAARRALT
jgi:hypothetical protein